MYIAEIAPADKRGKMVSFNQLNIVIGLSVAFFTNYLIVHLAGSDAAWVDTLKIREYNWRWMLGIEFLPGFLHDFIFGMMPQKHRHGEGKSKNEPRGQHTAGEK